MPLFPHFLRRLENSKKTASMSPTAVRADDLKALVGILSNAVDVVTAEYAKGGHVVPSLDSTEPACAQLGFAVASPGHVMTNKSYGYYEPSALLVACNAKVADILLDKPDGMHISEIAKASRLDQGKLGRIIRMLVTKHCFREVKPDVFANNRLSVKLLSTDPVSGLVGHIEALFDPKSGHSSLAADTSFKRAHGCPVFDYYGTPEGNKRLDAMVGWGDVTGKGNLPKAYPWSTCQPGTIVCDVGGGNGHIMLDLVGSVPQLKIVVQDTPAVIEQAKELWSKDKPDSVQSGSVRFEAMDFLKDAPVASCDFYYLRHVLHDWPDSECLKILQNVRKAAQWSSKLLLHEFVLQHVVRGSGSAIEEVNVPGFL
ncbi:hypothetical protein D9757_005107 [Collybiopsis confluens]|uniref:O-methyltransferase domain-containing protein n=1 Tax=Collybiopsis confluens TaxID=2823264 RepID=A0A8H5MCK0_9AGAR|nr:hypothetical protein D9757_005107 [Collybiopsis confluens]